MRLQAFMLLLLMATVVSADAPGPSASWARTLVTLYAGTEQGDPEELSRSLWRNYPMEMDWWMQDDRRNRGHYPALSDGIKAYLAPNRDTSLEQQLIETVLGQLPASDERPFRRTLTSLLSARAPVQDARWLTLYSQACQKRRQRDLTPVVAACSRILFVKRQPVRPSFFGYTEGQSDAQHESHFVPGASLCLLTWEDPQEIQVMTLLDDLTGVIRDLDVSWDGQRILYAHKKSPQDDYHLYEMHVESRTTRQLTFGQGVADYECRYLPSGDILFTSSRCVQTVDCWWTEVSNLYCCDRDGRYQRKREALACEVRRHIEQWYEDQYKTTIKMMDPSPRHLDYQTAGPGLK